MKKVAVIGSNSFSGSHFINLILTERNFKVVGISRSPEKGELFLPYKQNPAKNRFAFFQMDLNKNMDDIKELLLKEKPEYIINFAAQSEVAPSWDHPGHWFQTNAVSLAELSNFLRKQNWLKRYVHISSPEVYGTCRGVVKENAPLNPTTPYAASKAAGDLLLFTMVKNFNFPMVMIRSTNVYGPYQQLFKIIPRTVIYLLSDRKIELHGGGAAIKSYIHIKDVSRGELAVMETGTNGGIYHLSPENGISIKELVKKICHIMGKSFKENTITVAERPGQDKAYIIDARKAWKEFGWKPQISIEEGLKDVLAWAKKYRPQIRQQPLEYIHKA